MRFSLLLTTLLLASILKAQHKDQLFIETGYGNYESAYIGISYAFTSKTDLTSLIGYQSVSADYKQFSVTMKLKRDIATITKRMKLNITPKLIFWMHEDENFIFKSLAMAPTVETEFLSFNAPISFYVSSGPNINYQLESTRKNQDKLAWPKKTTINWSIGVRFRI